MNNDIPGNCPECGQVKVQLTRRSTRNYTYHCPCDGRIVVGQYDVLSFKQPAAFQFLPLEGDLDLMGQRAIEYLRRIKDRDFTHGVMADVRLGAMEILDGKVYPEPMEDDVVEPKTVPRQLNPQPGDLLGDSSLEMLAPPGAETSEGE